MNRQSDTFRCLSDQVQESIEAGASIADAARSAGCAPRTVERWLQRGRAEPDGPYGDFARRRDAARTPPEIVSGPIGEREWRELVDAAARAGSVAAMRLWWTMHKARPE